MTHSQSLKVIAKQNNWTVAALREIARDLDLDVRYDHTGINGWYLNENAATVKAFYRHTA